MDVELVLEAKRALEIEGGRDARPPDVAPGRMDAEARLAPERVLRLLHVAEEPAEMNDAGDVGFVELDAATESVLDHVYRMPTCSGLKNRGRSVSTRRSPSRDSATTRPPASAR